MLRIRTFSDAEVERFRRFEIAQSHFLTINVGGGIYGGNWNYVLALHEVFFWTIDEWIKRNLFIGKDQNILSVISNVHPELVNLVGPVSANPWFYLQDYLLESGK
jgi:hypothetical protein